jgi:hypothetical protein
MNMTSVEKGKENRKEESEYMRKWNFYRLLYPLWLHKIEENTITYILMDAIKMIHL